MSQHPQHDPKRSRFDVPQRRHDDGDSSIAGWIILAIVIGIVVALAAMPQAAQAQTPLYGHTVVTSGDLRTGDTVVTIGMSNWNQISQQVRFPSVNFINAACGGCTVSGWATGNATLKGRPLWNAVPANADIIWLNPVNRANAKYSTLGAYITGTTNDTFRVLDYIEANYNVREVWLTGLHGEPFAPASSKQPNNYAHASGLIADNVPKDARYPFRVIHAAYIYAETKPRADGLFWELSDFSSDKLHLSDSGNTKAANLLEDYMASAIGNPTPDPDPTPEPESCPVPKWANECRLVSGVCRCR